MLDERIAGLIQADVDGELPASDRPELERVLAESEEARRFRDEMLQIARVLSTLPQVEPPPGMTRRIRDMVELPARRRWLAFGGGLSSNWFGPASYGLAVAAGVLIAVGIAQVVPSGTHDIQNLVGSMVRQDGALPAPAIARLGIEAPGVSGEARLAVLDGTQAIEFDLESKEPFELQIDLVKSGLQFGGIADPEAGVQVIDFSGGEVRVVNQGRHRFVLFVRPEAGMEAGSGIIGIVISQDGETLFRGRLQSKG